MRRKKFSLKYVKNNLCNIFCSCVLCKLWGCYKPKGCSRCIALDPKYQAIDEVQAVLNFIDLTSGDPSKSKQWVPKNNEDTNGKCASNACKGCLQMFIDRLEANLPKTAEYQPIWAALTQQKLTNGLNGNNFRSYCSNLKNISQPIPPTASISGAELTSVIGSIVANTQCGGVATSNTTKPRQKRQSGFTVGTLSTMNCNYRRGNTLNDGLNYVGMCNLCNAVRTLPSQYYPRYINELSCDHGDTRCLSGYGTCRERYRSIEVLINYGTDQNPRYTQYSVNTPVGCECQVQSGSALANLVSN